MRAHQPGSTPIDIPETVPNPVHTPAPCARTGAGADQSAGKGARKSNRTGRFRLAAATPRAISSPISITLQRDTERRPRNSDRQFHSNVKINHRAEIVARDDQPMMF